MQESLLIGIGISIALLAAAGLVTLLIMSLIWVYKDAEARGKPGWAIALAVLLLKWPLSLLLWVVFRPEPVGVVGKPLPS